MKKIRTTQEVIKDLLRSTNRPGIDELINWLDESDFFTAPASTIYHGSYAGGLADHSLNVCRVLDNLACNFEYDFGYGGGIQVPSIQDDSVIIVGLLHDVCKVNTYVEGTRNVKNPDTGKWDVVPCYKREPLLAMGHGGKSIFILQQFITLTVEEAEAIFWHMGAYDISQYMTVNELGKTFESNFLAYALHTADMMATYVIENKNYKQ
jgi:hypothetical protein